MQVRGRERNYVTAVSPLSFCMGEGRTGPISLNNCDNTIILCAQSTSTESSTILLLERKS
jgi:hypothetical protein